MYIQKIFKAGNSDVVAIPKDIITSSGIKFGTKVSVDSPQKGVVVIRSQAKSKIKQSKTSQAEFDQWLNQFMDENGGVLDDLATR